MVRCNEVAPKRIDATADGHPALNTLRWVITPHKFTYPSTRREPE